MWTVLGLVGYVGLAIAGCATVAGHLPPPHPAPASGHFQAGVARVDITPAPGVPMGGHSKVGQTSIGYWTRLYARAFLLEDASGNTLVLVSCDLWSVPAGLVDRVAEILLTREETRHIDRDQLILAATHTHHSPGNGTAEPHSRWCTMWLGAPMATEPLHFQVHTLRGATVISPPIPPATHPR